MTSQRKALARGRIAPLASRGTVPIAALAKIMMSHGAVGVTCAKVSQAAAMVEGGGLECTREQGASGQRPAA